MRTRWAGFASLWVVALAFGWIEASVVVYLREIYAREVALQGASSFAGLQVTMVSLPARLVAQEMAREACTVLLLGGVAWLAGRRLADRAGAFLLAFGVWDLAYYAALWLVLGWPDSLAAWDILFLIPLPWVAPVWAPATVAAIFVVAGSYLFLTPESGRRYRWPDAAVLAASSLLTIAAFLVESQAAIDHRVPERFPAWLFWAGVVLGTAWFLRVEARAGRRRAVLPPWVGVRVRTIPPESHQAEPVEGGGAVEAGLDGSGRRGVDRVIREYSEARRRLDALLAEAAELGERLERLAHGLSAHPRRMVIGRPDRFVEDPGEWDVVPDHELPRIEALVSLTDAIRGASLSVEELRERLVLLGRGDLVEQPGGYFR